jgi:hypothetical protein
VHHHFVPQFLLEPWTVNSTDGRLQVFRLDIGGLPTSRRTPKYTAFEPDLYALTRDAVAGMSKHDVERKFLALVDSHAAVARRRMLEQGLASLSVDDRVHWARFLMSLRVRQPAMVDLVRRDAATELRQHLQSDPELYEAEAGDDDPPTMEEWVEKRFPGLIDNFGMSFFHELIDNADVGTKLLAMRWWLCRLDDARFELLLGDHPCIFTHGIDAPEQIVALPVAPRVAFLATRGDRINEAIRSTAPSRLTERINESSVGQARARVYARDASQRRFIQNRLNRRSTSS